jgi:hypothetical protein
MRTAGLILIIALSLTAIGIDISILRSLWPDWKQDRQRRKDAA